MPQNLIRLNVDLITNYIAGFFFYSVNAISTTTTPSTKTPIILSEMSALAQLAVSPALGFKELVEDWSVKERLSFKIADKDHERVIYTCVVPECQWRIRANQTVESDVKITVLNSEYNRLLENVRKRY